jgi:hypothetical protein
MILKDWRAYENREELFFRWLDWRFKEGGIDHHWWNLGYANTSHSPTGKPMTLEQKLWFSFLFGMTYQSSQAWVFYWHFPDYDKIDLVELDKWNRETMPRQKFATDTRYNKGHIVRMVQSFQEFVNRRGQGNIVKAFESCLVDDQTKSYHNLNEEIQKLYKFGRMTGWLFSQCLAEVADLPIRPDTLFINDPANTSVWNGLMFYYGQDTKTVGEQYANYKPTPQDRELAAKWERELMARAKDRISDPYLSYFTLETHLCQCKKLFVGRDYPGQNTGDAVERYEWFKAHWPEVNFQGFADTVDAKVASTIRWKGESKALMKLFERVGSPINLHERYPEDMPNMYQLLGIPEGWKEYDEDREKIIASKIAGYDCFTFDLF